MSDHNHSTISRNIDRKFIIGIFLNISFVFLEAGSGFYYNSLALLSDAGHNLSDVASLVLALFAFRLAKVKPDYKYTYGYRKTTVLISLLNAVFLLVATGAIIWESVERFQKTTNTDGNPIAIVAGIGIFINALTAWLFLADKDRDLNIKGAYLHMLSDTLVSLGVLVAGILIIFTNWHWLDSAISIVVAIVILFNTIGLLISSFNLSIDAVPEGIDIASLKKEMEQIKGVLEVHHIHIWGISTTLNAFTAHVKVQSEMAWEEIVRIKSSIRHILQHQNILHSTIEFETTEEYCEEKHTQI